MKKLTTILLATAALLVAAVSCNKEGNEPEGRMAVLSYDVNLSEVTTKAFGDGSTVDRLACAVYDGEELYACTKVAKADGKFAYAPSLYYGKTYTVVFFAYKENAYTVSEDLKTITRSGNGEAADAFTYRETVKIKADGTLVVNGEETTEKAESHSVTLSRPFAQLNIGTESLEDITKVGATKVKVILEGAASSYSAVTGECAGSENVEYTSVIADFSSNNFSVKVDESISKVYALVSLNYLLVRDNVKATIQTLNNNEENVRTLTISNLPLGKNQKTNIYGNLVKGELTFNVTVNPTFSTTENGSTI